VKFNENVVATTKDWLRSAEGMNITAYYPGVEIVSQQNVAANEPDQAVHLSAADRARMNRVRPGVDTEPEQL